MNRRAFLKLLLAAPAIAATVDVEQLLWTPKPMVTVPAMPTGLSFHRDAFCFVSTDMALADYQRQYNHIISQIAENMGVPSPLVGYMEDRKTGISMRYVDQWVISDRITRYDLLVGVNGKAEG